MSYLPSSKRKQYVEENKPNVCPITGKAFVNESDYSLDHDHYITGRVRGVISRAANVLLGKAENHFYRMMGGTDPNKLSKALREAARYIEQDFSKHPYHWEGVKQETNRFGRFPAEQQKKILIEMGLEPASNLKQRKKQYMNKLKGKL